jgi:hypothetical protein
MANRCPFISKALSVSLHADKYSMVLRASLNFTQMAKHHCVRAITYPKTRNFNAAVSTTQLEHRG